MNNIYRLKMKKKRQPLILANLLQTAFLANFLFLHFKNPLLEKENNF